MVQAILDSEVLGLADEKTDIGLTVDQIKVLDTYDSKYADYLTYE